MAGPVREKERDKASMLTVHERDEVRKVVCADSGVSKSARPHGEWHTNRTSEKCPLAVDSSLACFSCAAAKRQLGRSLVRLFGRTTYASLLQAWRNVASPRHWRRRPGETWLLVRWGVEDGKCEGVDVGGIGSRAAGGRECCVVGNRSSAIPWRAMTFAASTARARSSARPAILGLPLTGLGWRFGRHLSVTSSGLSPKSFSRLLLGRPINVESRTIK